jgi:ASC-1-like (ASCH) protein
MADHLAIMRKSWGLLPKILNGAKTIESRWYKHKYAPWDAIDSGDTVYFKNSGEPVTVKATVSHVLQFDNLNPQRVEQLLLQYGRADGIEFEQVDSYAKMFAGRKYCLLIFLVKPEPITPFKISKVGYGAMAAWIRLENINQIKITELV